MFKVLQITLVGLLLIASLSLAQSFLGSITGVVTDPTGAVIPNAKVEVTDLAKGSQRAATTDNEGRYAFSDLAPGTYVVTVSATGFKDQKSGQIILTAQQNSRFDASLEVGAGVQTVEVTVSAPTLNTENSELSSIQQRQELVNMPLNRRSTIEYFFMTSGSYANDGDYSVGGLRGSQTNLTVDGVSSNSTLWGGDSGPLTEEGFEAISDMKILESNNSAEFPGVATVMISTRSGGNQPHGTLFLTEHNYATDANAYFGGKGRGPERHEFGGSLGGPVFIPKLYNGRNRTFFNFTWEHTTFPAGSGNQTDFAANVPTPPMKQGDFSSLLPNTVIKDPTNGAPFAGNIIPTARISSVAQGLQTFGFLDPNWGPADNYIANWQGRAGQPENLNRWVIRGDQRLGEKDTLSGRASIFNDNMQVLYDNDWNNGSLPLYKRHQIRNSRQAYLSETHTFTAALINELKVSFARDYSDHASVFNGAQVASQAGLEGIDPNGANLTGVPHVTFSNFTSIYARPQASYKSQLYELMDNATWQKGAHNIKAGLLIRYAQPAMSDEVDDFGTFNFNGFASGFDYADFLLGVPYSTKRASRAPNRYNRYTNTGVFLQDAWNISPKLSLTYGLRWEYFMPPVDKNDMRFAFDPATGNLVVPNQHVIDTLISPLYPKSIPIVTAQAAGYASRSLLNGDWKNFGPRVGFAYRLSKGSVLRGGYGLYYAGLTDILMAPYSSGPFGTTENFTNVITNGVPLLQFPNPFSGSPEQAGTQSVQSTSPNLKPHRVQQWSLTFERDLGRSIVARASYRGFFTTQIPYEADLNVPPASANPSNAGLFFYPDFATVNYDRDGGIQKMNALDLTLERHFSSGLTFQAGYTLAKNMSDVGDNGEHATIEDPFNRARDMANVKFMPRQRFVGNLIWDIPVGRGKQFGAGLPKIVNGILGNWQTSMVSVIQSGQFLTPTYDGDQPNVRGSGLRADRVGDWHVSNQSPDNWFNPAAFAIPAAGMYGNCSRGVVVGPGLFNLDFGLHKYFHITEKVKLEIQARSTNVLNHPNFGNPEMNISSGGVGHITSMQGDSYDSLGASERRMRLGFRLEF